MIGPMVIAPKTVIMVLKGIEQHARAGNFDQIEIQARSLIQDLSADDLAGEDRDLYSAALPVIEHLPGDAEQEDAAAVIDHVHSAQELLGFAPE